VELVLFGKKDRSFLQLVFVVEVLLFGHVLFDDSLLVLDLSRQLVLVVFVAGLEDEYRFFFASDSSLFFCSSSLASFP